MKQTKKQKRVEYKTRTGTIKILPATKRLLERTTITEKDYLKPQKEQQAVRTTSSSLM